MPKRAPEIIPKGLERMKNRKFLKKNEKNIKKIRKMLEKLEVK